MVYYYHPYKRWWLGDGLFGFTILRSITIHYHQLKPTAARRFSRLAEVIVWASEFRTPQGTVHGGAAGAAVRPSTGPAPGALAALGSEGYFGILWHVFLEYHWRLWRYLEIYYPVISYWYWHFLGGKHDKPFVNFMCLTVPLGMGGVHLWKQQLPWGPRGFWNRGYGRCVRGAGRKWIGM